VYYSQTLKIIWLSNISKLSEPTESYFHQVVNAINHRVIEIGDIYADLNPTIDAMNKLLRNKCSLNAYLRKYSWKPYCVVSLRMG
jgi:hypothetical protein